MKKKTDKRERERREDDSQWRCVFSWRHFALIGVALSFIVVGCILMLPETDVRNTVGGRYAPAPGPGAFDSRRIKVAPSPCFIGFAMMIPAIMMKKNDE